MKKNEYKLLNDEIMNVQLEKFVRDVDGTMKKETNRSLRRLAIILPIVLLVVAGIVLIHNPIVLVLGIALLTGTVIVDGIIEEKKMYKKFDNMKNPSPFEEKDIDELLREGVGQKKGRDFYNENIKSALAVNETKEERRYRETLEKQRLEKEDYNTGNEDNLILSKEETMIRLVDELDYYCFVYKMPLLKLKNKDWENFFNIIYSKFLEKGFEASFYEALSVVFRYTVAKALVNNSKNIFIENFIDNLYYLENDLRREGVSFSKKEIMTLRREIENSFNRQKVISIKDYVGDSNGKIRRK